MITATFQRAHLQPFIIILCIVQLTAASCADHESPETDVYFPRLGNYADLYLRGSYDLLHMVRARELDKAGKAAAIAAGLKMNGGILYSRITTPHIMYAGACAPDVPGNPNIAPDYTITDPRYDAMPELGEGDFLMIADPGMQDARRRGCFVLGIGYPMSTNRYSPPAFNDHPEQPMESQVDMMIYTWGPKEDGLVTPRLTPHLKICPTSPMTVVGYWMMTAQIAWNLAHGDTSGSYDAAQTYLDSLMSRLERFHYRHIDDINRIGPVMAERILDGGRIYPWSSRWEFYQEASGTAGSVMGIYPIHPEGFYTGPGPYHPPELDPADLTARDIVIIAVAGADQGPEIEMARQARERGAYVIGIYPFEREDGLSTKEMNEYCHESLDSMSGDYFGVLDMPGYEHSIIPTLSMMNNYAFWSLIASYVQEMERRGVAPHYWMSWHVPGGRAYDDSVHPHFLERGY